MRFVLVLLFLGNAAALAAELTDVQQLAQRYPPGSIATKEVAEHAISEAASVHSRLERDFDAERLRCEHVFFVNRCLGAAHAVQRSGEQVVRRVTLEAHDLERHIDAHEHAESRAAELRRQAAEELQRPERERQAMQAAQAREQNAQARAQDALRGHESAEQARSVSEQRQRDQEAEWTRKDELRPPQEAESLREFQQKQEQAAAYAQSRERDRQANAKRRAEREAAREQQNAAVPAAPPDPAKP